MTSDKAACSVKCKMEIEIEAKEEYSEIDIHRYCTICKKEYWEEACPLCGKI